MKRQKTGDFFDSNISELFQATIQHPTQTPPRRKALRNRCTLNKKCKFDFKKGSFSFFEKIKLPLQTKSFDFSARYPWREHVFLRCMQKKLKIRKQRNEKEKSLFIKRNINPKDDSDLFRKRYTKQ